MKGKSVIRSRSEILKNSGQQFADMGIVTGVNSTNSVMQADAIMTALNVSISHEPANFSLVLDPTKKEEIGDAEATRQQILALEPTPIKATDKFRGTDPTSGKVEILGELQDIKRSSFYEQDDEIPDNYQQFVKSQDENLLGQMKIAMGKSLSTPTAKSIKTDGTNNSSTHEKYRGTPGRKKVNVI